MTLTSFGQGPRRDIPIAGGYQDRDRMLRQVTFTPSTSGPLGTIGGHLRHFQIDIESLLFFCNFVIK
jgi:hypothetical protein